ncbi:MAG: hypothetical protein GY841_05365 [FCB group bacterium]|nr:hypothetical protein [FCB group bacterium]
MSRIFPEIICLAFLIGIYPAMISAGVITFDAADWETGDVNEASPADSNGSSTNSHIDDFYYYERIPMRMISLADSLSEGSSGRSYDSAVFSLVVASQGLSGADSMLIFGRRLSHDWSESGVSWQFYWASTDSAWSVAGGDFNSQSCTDTVLIDAAVEGLDTIYFHLDTGFVRVMIESADYGWLMMAKNLVDRGTFQVYTEDVANEAYRPTLTVYYSDGGPEERVLARRRRESSQNRR